MSNIKTLSDAIFDSHNTGQDPKELQSITKGATIANGTTKAAITNASTSNSFNATYNHTEVETAMNAMATQLNLALAAIKAFKITN